MTHKVDNDILIPEIDILLQQGKDVRFTPAGFSMRPFIEGERDMVVLRHLPSVRIGDIVLAQITSHLSPVTSNPYVLHRVIAINNEILTLQGDGNLSGTEQCLKQDVVGTVVQIIRPDGRNKRLTRGRLWYYLRPFRKILLKIYRHL